MWSNCPEPSASCPGVELSHQLTVGRSGRGQLVAALLQLPAQLEDLLFPISQRLLQTADIVRCPEAAFAEDSLAQALRQAALQGGDVLLQPGCSARGG